MASSLVGLLGQKFPLFLHSVVLSLASWWAVGNVGAVLCCRLPTPSSFSFLSPVFLLHSFSLPLTLSVFIIVPSPTSSCRYLTPCSKTDYYVTEWVEDVNKNTEGPYIRYYLRLLRIPLRIHFAFFILFYFYYVHRLYIFLLF